ncbi:PREDICTED: uncharacterized protein LOC104792399 [Camelina sativa]|uniref:Uncharacterized protein LOC104792399 n=1 Tax=Camelina sativa TaxID=90675 RepID=A0ABM0ZK11_CAMSA|nr:PREDICTED: uncharacterized protein LOC104792399 [Camelina sativa]
MSWLWKKDSSSSFSSDAGSDFTDQQLGDSNSNGYCTTTEVERKVCKTTKGWRGKSVKKCEESKEFHIRCVGKPYRVVQTNTEDDLKAFPKQDDEKPPMLSIDAGAMKRKMKEALGTSR